MTYFATAFRYQPDNPHYAGSYGGAAYTARIYAEAEKGWSAARDLYRELAAIDPGAAKPGLAGTLTNLGLLYNDTGRFADSAAAYGEALAILREFAARDPGAQRPGLATLLSNLGALYGRPPAADAGAARRRWRSAASWLLPRPPTARSSFPARNLNLYGPRASSPVPNPPTAGAGDQPRW
jgi:tetratricopeptide (TPR) repeat protein